MLRNNRFSFTGEGGQYFGILIGNLLLSLVTLGIYIPWAIVSEVKYNLSHTNFPGKPFSYTGSGKDLFLGFLYFIGAMILLGFLMYIHIALYFVGILSLVLVGLPYAIHEGLDYDSKHTHWNGHTFAYDGVFMDFFKLFVTNIVLTMVTFGIYSSWASVAISKYTLQHLKLGRLTFDFEGEGKELFFINLKGFFFSIFTLGIYMFWYVKNLNVYNTNHLVVYQDGKKCNFNSQLQVGDVFNMLFVGMLIVIFTLGFGVAWVQVRNTKILLAAVDISEELDPENIG